MTYIPIEIRCNAGRPQHCESDYARRRRLYARWHRRLGFTQRQLSALTGLSVSTIAGYHSRTRKDAVPTDQTIFLMREEAIRRARLAEREAEDRLLMAEITRERWEEEVREHAAGIFGPDAQEDEEAA